MVVEVVLLKVRGCGGGWRMSEDVMEAVADKIKTET